MTLEGISSHYGIIWYKHTAADWATEIPPLWIPIWYRNMMSTPRRPYRTDLSDARWALIEPMLSAWRGGRAGLGISPIQHDLREIVNAILYVNRTGVPWEYLPHDFPPYKLTATPHRRRPAARADDGRGVSGQVRSMPHTAGAPSDDPYGAQLGRRGRKHLTQLGWTIGTVNPAAALLRARGIDPVRLRAELDRTP